MIGESRQCAVVNNETESKEVGRVNALKKNGSKMHPSGQSYSVSWRRSRSVLKHGRERMCKIRGQRARKSTESLKRQTRHQPVRGITKFTKRDRNDWPRRRRRRPQSPRSPNQFHLQVAAVAKRDSDMAVRAARDTDRGQAEGEHGTIKAFAGTTKHKTDMDTRVLTNS